MRVAGSCIMSENTRFGGILLRAEIIHEKQAYTATFERHLTHQPKEVWAMLADNEKLQQWFPELKIEKLGKGGLLRFDMGDGSFEKMAITEYDEGKILAFEWAEDHVRFELIPENKGTLLRLVETISKITPQTAKDLAGWHVCLDVIQAILDGQEIERMEEWEKWYPEYKRLLDSMTVEFE